MLKKQVKLIAFLVFAVIIGFIGWRVLGKKKQQVQYQTTQAEKGTLVMSISASGQVSAANNASVTTQSSGVVSKVYVKNDQAVRTGDKIAELELDLEGKLRSTQAWASYQGAKNNLESAKVSFYSLQSTMLTNWKTYMDMAQNSTYQNPDGSPNMEKRQLVPFMVTNNDWLAAEAKYKNQQNVVNQAQTSLNSSWLNYQQASSIIYAPINGTVTGLSLQQGTVLSAQSNTSGTATSQKIASIKTNAPAQIMVSISEIDVTKIKIGNKAIITLDAFPEKTYTGKVISIDTIGAISSGVTSYPAVVSLDTQVIEILPNMAVNAKIITNIIDNAILVPNAAIQTADGQSMVRMMKNGKISEITVEIAGSNDIQTAISSGINEGEVVVTNMITPTSETTQGRQTQSIFGGFGGRGFGGGR